MATSICRDDAEVELQGVRERSRPFSASWVLGHHYRLLPVDHVISDPPGNERFCKEIVNRLAKEALHL